MSEQHLERDARAKLAEAVRDYANSWERDGIVTGYICVFELTGSTGIPECWWMTGSGADPTATDQAGLAAHRALGLLAYATRVIKRGIKR